MVKKSKKQVDDRVEEGTFAEVPEDRLEQLNKEEIQESREEIPPQNSTDPIDPERASVSSEASTTELDQPEMSRENLLADIRQSLAADEVVVEPKGFLGWIKKRFNKSPKMEEKDSETQARLDSLLERPDDLPKVAVEPSHRGKEPTNKRDEERALKDFFADLEALADIEVEEYVPPVPEPRGDLPVKVQNDAISAPSKIPVKSPAEGEVEFDALRAMALEAYDETRIEIEEPKLTFREEMLQTIRELKPFEKMLLFSAGAFILILMLSSGIFLFARSVTTPNPTATAIMDLTDTIHPTQLTLPGGWSFNLGQGRVVEGEWNPQRAEWLAGTEISRWVALPWSLQLEAVLRTLKPEDKLELTMSNFDVLVFNAYSIRELTMEELLASDPKTPGLLVVLYNDEETEGKYWVVEARP